MIPGVDHNLLMGCWIITWFPTDKQGSGCAFLLYCSTWSSFERRALFSRTSAAICYCGVNDRRCAGMESRTCLLKTICAGDAPPERGAFRNINILLQNLFGSNAPDVHDPSMSVFIVLISASALPFD